MLALKAVLLIGLCLLAAPAAINGERARYDNYRVYKVTPSTEAQLSLLKQLDEISDSVNALDDIQMVAKEVSIVVAPHKVPDFLDIMGKNEIQYTLAAENLQALLEDDDDVQVAGGRAEYSWTAYYELDDTYTWLQSLSKAYPQAVTLIEGGKTYEGRSILGVRISYNRGGAQKPGIFLEAGIHAREWIAPATATYIINELLTSKDSAIRSVAESYDWYIFPHANPDGYVYTHKSDRMWRKTRTPYGLCYGADPNRNWGFHWNEVGASNVACSDTYAGPKAFSEIETRSLSNYISSLTGKIQLYISFHAYSQYLLYPYGHTSQLPPNGDDFKRVFNAATAAINKRYSTKYTGGNIYDAIYPAAGASVDWAYGNVGTKMAFCYELRPASNQQLIGFRLPADQIIPTGEETLDSIIAMVAEVKTLGYFKL